MSSINDVPTELLDHIVKLVDKPIALMSVCRKFKAVATPIAYCHIQLKTAALPTDVQLLLHTIISQPDLRSHIRFLCCNFLHWEPSVAAVEMYPHEFSELTTKATARGLPEEVQINLRNGFTESMFLLLLLYLPALHSLHIQSIDHVDGLFIRQLSPTTGLCSALQSLHILLINQAALVWDGDCLTSLMRLPALRILSLYHADFDCVVSSSELPPGSSSVEQILIEHSESDDYSLPVVIHASQALRCLKYRLNRSEMISSFHVSSTWNVLLKCAKHTLESLDLIFPEEHPIGPVGSPGSLCDFTQLTQVYSTLTILIGPPSVDHDPVPLSMVLPQSLVSLAVWVEEDWWGRSGQPLLQLLISKSNSFRQLKELCVGGTGIERGELDAVQSACLAEGVEFGGFEIVSSTTGLTDLEDDGPCFHDI